MPSFSLQPTQQMGEAEEVSGQQPPLRETEELLLLFFDPGMSGNKFSSNHCAFLEYLEQLGASPYVSCCRWCTQLSCRCRYMCSASPCQQCEEAGPGFDVSPGSEIQRIENRRPCLENQACQRWISENAHALNKLD